MYISLCVCHKLLKFCNTQDQVSPRHKTISGRPKQTRIFLWENIIFFFGERQRKSILKVHNIFCKNKFTYTINELLSFYMFGNDKKRIIKFFLSPSPVYL